MKRGIFAVVVLAFVISALFAFSAHAQTANPECTTEQTSFFIRMRCLFETVVDKTINLLGIKTKDLSSQKTLVLESIIPVDRLLVAPFALQPSPQAGGYGKSQSFFVGSEGKKIFLGVGTRNQLTVVPSPGGQYQTVNTRGFIVEYKEKPIIEYKKELEQKLFLAQSLSVKGSGGSLFLNQAGEIQLKAQLKDYESKIEQEHAVLENSIAAKLSISKSELENKILGEFKNTFNGIALDITAEEVGKVMQLPGVKNVYPNFEVKIFLNESVPLIDADKVWKLDKEGNECARSGKDCLRGKGVTIGIIDTGVDYTHPDLGGCLGQNCKVVGGYDFANNDSDPMDDQGHGTHVAATAAGNGILRGVAPEAKIYAYKVLDAGGSGWGHWIIAGIERAVDPNSDGDFSDRLDVINLSLGGWGDPDDPMSQAIDRAVDTGVVAVVAAGNSGSREGSIGSPGTARKAITVAASDKSDKIANFSSRGPVKWEDSKENVLSLLKPDITAPGVLICAAQWDNWLSDHRCLDDKHIAISGTSMAAPHVAGLAALLKQKFPHLEPAYIKSILKKEAVNLGDNIKSQGYGRIDSLNSINNSLAVILSGPEMASGLISFSGAIVSQGPMSPSKYRFSYGRGYESGKNDWILLEEKNFSGYFIPLGLDSRSLEDGLYTIKLEVFDGKGQKAEDRMYLTIDGVSIDIRNYEEFFNDQILKIYGSAVKNNLNKYQLYVRNVFAPESSPILIKESNIPIQNGVLGELDLSSEVIRAGGLYEIRLSTFDAKNQLIEQDKKIIYVEDKSSLHNGWPVKLDSFGTYSSFNAFDVDGDKNLELFFGNDFYDQPWDIKPNFQGFKHDGNRLPGWPVGFDLRGGSYSSPAIADIDENGRPEIAILTQNNSKLFVFDQNKETVFTHGSMGYTGGLESAPAIADLDNDGYQEIIYPVMTIFDPVNKEFQSELRVVDYEGKNFGKFPLAFDGFIYGQAIGDLNNDGFLDIVFGVSVFRVHQPNRNLVIYAISGRDGAVLSQIVLKGEATNSPVLGDVDGDEKLEIIVAVRDDSQTLNQGIYVLDVKGNVLPGWPKYVLVAAYYYTDLPSVADVDGDGKPEIFFIDYNGTMYGWHYDGIDLRGWPKHGLGTYNFTQPIIVDIDGDGKPEIITQGSHDGSFVSYYDRPNLVFAFHVDGSLVTSFPKQTIRRSCRVNGSSPLVSDIDNDGLVELVSHSQDDIFCNGKRGNNLFVKVWDLRGKAPAGGAEWPMFMHDSKNTGLYLVKEKKPLDTPANLTAFLIFSTSTPTSSPMVQLRWEDTSGAEDGFEIWRSVRNQNNFAFLKSPLANSTSTEDLISKKDESIKGAHYFYKVRAFKNEKKCPLDFLGIRVRIFCEDRQVYSDFSNMAEVQISPTTFDYTIIKPGEEIRIPKQNLQEILLESLGSTGGIFPEPSGISNDSVIYRIPVNLKQNFNLEATFKNQGILEKQLWKIQRTEQ